MTDIIITNRIRVKELIKTLQEEFKPDDVLETGLWIRELEIKVKKRRPEFSN